MCKLKMGGNLKIENQNVATVFNEYPPFFRKRLMALRSLILKTAKSLPEIGELEETLKWGEPSYLPKKKNIGTTVRIHWLESKPHQYALYFNCQTNLILKYKKKYPHLFNYEGNRAVVFTKDDELPVKALKDCIAMALTYHLKK